MPEAASAPSRLRIPGGDIEYAWSMAPDRNSTTTLTLLHEGLGCVSLWRDFPSKLAKATGYDCFSYSRFGYGGSDPCDLPRPASYMHDEALEYLSPVLDAAGVEKTILVGHSDGASIAAIYAGAVSDPRISALVLMAPHFRCEARSLDGIRAARDAWDNTQLRQKLRKHHGDNVDCAFYGWNDGWQTEEFADWDLTAYLDDIRVPVLAIQGRDDAYGTQWQVEVVNERLPTLSTVELLDNCGHAPHQDQTERVLELISDFIKAL